MILSNNQSKATRWVLDTCLIVGLRPFIIILITASLSSKDIQHSTGARMCSVRWNVINVDQIEIGVLCWNLFSLFGGMFADKFLHGSLTSLILLVLFGVE